MPPVGTPLYACSMPPPQGKRLLADKYDQMGDRPAGAHIRNLIGSRLVTYAEMNQPMGTELARVPAGVPTQSNPLERQNGVQKNRLEHKREGITQFLETAATDLEQVQVWRRGWEVRVGGESGR